jgi:hypothetical protein
MKKLFALSAVALLTLYVVAVASALDASTGIDDSDLMTWVRNSANGPGTVDAGYPIDEPGPGVKWHISPPVGLSVGQWWDIEVGDDYPVANIYEFPVATGFADWTGYDTYSLTFTNQSTDVENDWFMANVVINTGWTDPPVSEPDNYYDGTWTWVAPGETKTVTLDLAGLANLNHVSNIAFKVGTNYGTAGDDYTGDHIKVKVAPVPEPSTILLMVGGLLGLAGYAGVRRRKRKES